MHSISLAVLSIAQIIRKMSGITANVYRVFNDNSVAVKVDLSLPKKAKKKVAKKKVKKKILKKVKKKPAARAPAPVAPAEVPPADTPNIDQPPATSW